MFTVPISYYIVLLDVKKVHPVKHTGMQLVNNIYCCLLTSEIKGIAVPI